VGSVGVDKFRGGKVEDEINTIECVGVGEVSLDKVGVGRNSITRSRRAVVDDGNGRAVSK